jgi:hypothetical protein
MPEEEKKRPYSCTAVNSSVNSSAQVKQDWFVIRIWDAYRIANKQMDELNETMWKLGIGLMAEPDRDFPEGDSMESAICKLQYVQYEIGRAITLIHNSL